MSFIHHHFAPFWRQWVEFPTFLFPAHTPNLYKLELESRPVSRLLFMNNTPFVFFMNVFESGRFMNQKRETKTLSNENSFRVKRTYQGSLNVSFHHPCFEQLVTILSNLTIISEKVGLTTGSGAQHSSINLHPYRSRIMFTVRFNDHRPALSYYTIMMHYLK